MFDLQLLVADIKKNNNNKKKSLSKEELLVFHTVFPSK